MSNIHPDDQIAVEFAHTQFCDRHGDAVIAMQDASYALGRERGIIDGKASALAGLQDLNAAVEQILDAGHMNTEDLARLRAAYTNPILRG